MAKKVINNIIIKLIICHTFLVLRYFDKYFDIYPSVKNAIKEDKEAPSQKNIFSFNIKFLEKFPRKKTVSEYTCGLRYVKPNVLSITDDSEFLFLLTLKLNLLISFRILAHIKLSKNINSNKFNINSISGVKKFWK